MLSTKEKINQKKGIKAEQTDLVETISNANKTTKNRRFVTITLFFTIALSAIFATYNLIKNSIKNNNYSNLLPKISLFKPKTDSTPEDTPIPSIDLSSLIEKKIKNYQGVWSFYIKYFSFDSEKVIYTRNESEFFSQNNPNETLKSLKDPKNQSKTFTKDLPNGLEIYEKNQLTEKLTESHILIILPNKKQIFILTKVTGIQDNSQLPSLIPQLLSDIYWSLIQSD
ncbi:hypothetical protein KKE45_03290 [Patescibacteria group bacterium]|nr:hypothetical protein [Patescibacteria group bacterium]